MYDSSSPNLVSLLKLENSKVLVDQQWPLLRPCHGGIEGGSYKNGLNMG